MNTRRTWLGSLLGLLTLSSLTLNAKSQPKAILGKCVAAPLPLRAMVSMPLEEYDKLKKDAVAYQVLKEELNKSAVAICGDKVITEDLTLVVCRKVDGSIIPYSENS